jgi:NRAMP (natural resistance-associated macrophage protein)-like metal ion transporter
LTSSAGQEPRVDLDRPVDSAGVELERESNPLRRAFKLLGPGLVTGASDDDPSGIGTYAQAGAQYGYATLWATVLMLPLMVSIQYICAKIGLVTGHGLAGALRQHYPRRVIYPAVFAMVIANTLNAGADIGAIAAAINLLVPIPAVIFVVPVSVGILAIQVFGSYRLIERVFKWLALALLAYIGSALLAHPQVLGVLRGTLIPTIRLDPTYIGILVALLGTTISPYLFSCLSDCGSLASGGGYRTHHPALDRMGSDVEDDPELGWSGERVLHGGIDASRGGGALGWA